MRYFKRMIIKEIKSEEQRAVISEIAKIDEALFPSNVWGAASYLKSSENDYDYLIAAIDEANAAEPEQQGVTAGFALLRCFDDAELVRIAVDKKYRRQGIGEGLLTALTEEAKGRGIHDIILEVRASNEPALRLYEKAGFTTEGIRRRYYSAPTEDAVIMRYKW